MNWKNKSAAAACELIKDNNGAGLVGHLKDSELIRWAIEIRSTPDGVVHPPPPVASKSAFVALVDRWEQLGELGCQ